MLFKGKVILLGILVLTCFQMRLNGQENNSAGKYAMK